MARVISEFKIKDKLNVFFKYVNMEQPMFNPGNCPIFAALTNFLKDTNNNTHLKLTHVKGLNYIVSY